MTDPAIRPAAPADAAAIRALTIAAFEASPLGHDGEAELIEALRAERAVAAEFVAEGDRGAIIGHILFSRLHSPGGPPLAALAPMSVQPGLQAQGVGGRLIAAGLEACRSAGFAGVVVVGHPAYYPRFGFSAALAEQLVTPYAGPACMALEWIPGALAGRVIAYPAAFGG